mmetsp:Transcript_24000/g.36022  ORF Transcript_24000/g.36022 Transcript_24000/m.36022 type:complete len:87 (-) Transcript_24000:217-477(-)
MDPSTNKDGSKEVWSAEKSATGESAALQVSAGRSAASQAGISGEQVAGGPAGVPLVLMSLTAHEASLDELAVAADTVETLPEKSVL